MIEYLNVVGTINLVKALIFLVGPKMEVLLTIAVSLHWAAKSGNTGNVGL